MCALAPGELNKTDLTKAVKEVLSDVGTNRIRDMINKLAGLEKIRETSGPRTTKLYSIR